MWAGAQRWRSAIKLIRSAGATGPALPFVALPNTFGLKVFGRILLDEAGKQKNAARFRNAVKVGGQRIDGLRRDVDGDEVEACGLDGSCRTNERRGARVQRRPLDRFKIDIASEHATGTERLTNG